MLISALLVTALLFGGKLLSSFGFAAFLFTMLPAASAGSTIRRAFPLFYLFVIGCAAVADVPAGFDTRSAATRNVVRRQLCPGLSQKISQKRLQEDRTA